MEIKMETKKHQGFGWPMIADEHDSLGSAI